MTNLEPQPGPARPHSLDAVKTWRYLRLSMVALVAALAAAVLYEHFQVSGRNCFQNSISAYYYTPARAVLVTALVGIGVAMVCLRGNTLEEDLLLNLAGMLTPIVAFVPTLEPSVCSSVESAAEARPANIANNVTALLIAGAIALAFAAWRVWRERPPRLARIALAVAIALWLAVLLVHDFAAGFFEHNAHGAAATVMFLCITGVACVNAREFKRASSDRNLYTPLAVAMTVVLGAHVVTLIVHWIANTEQWEGQTIVVESVLLLLFATFWLIQTAELWDQGLRPRKTPMIADLHCHFPMHLVAKEPDPDGPNETWLRQFITKVDDVGLELAARFVNNASWIAGWRISSTDSLADGGAGLVCSVLYWPAAEFDIERLNGAPPRESSFEELKNQLAFVEKTLAGEKARTPISVVRSVDDLAKPGIRFVHCVEGGFHLGEDVNKLDERVRWLAEQGVLYITVAHLFYREIATEAPAIPIFETDADFRAVFPERGGPALTERGQMLIEAMHRHKILLDISHMSERAIAEAFALIEQLDKGRPKADYPVIATHVGMRSAAQAAKAQEYNLSDATARKIAERGGVIGLIAAQHQLGPTQNEADSAALLKAHLDAIGAAVGDATTVAALGTDIDGFIKPTLSGFEKAGDFAKLKAWVEAAEPKDPNAILCGNAERVIRAALTGRLSSAPLS